MAGIRKSHTRSVEKIFDRLAVQVMNHELLLGGGYGPLNQEQKAVLSDLINRSQEIATLLREILDT